MTAPDPRLDEIQARLSAATNGPWKIDKDDPTNLVSIVSTADDRPWGWVEVARSLNPDAEFIANSRADVAYLIDELLKARRAAQTLGQVIDKQCLDVLEVTGLHHLINEDGDGHWDVVWMRLHEMAAELRKAHEALTRVEALAAKIDKAFNTDHSVDVQMRATAYQLRAAVAAAKGDERG